MDLYVKAETERLAKAEQCRRRQLRIAQVRQQTSDWTSRSRAQFKAEKDRHIKRYSDSLVADVQNQATEQIKYHAEAHYLAVSEIGAAHRAAANMPDFKTMTDRQKMRDDRIAQIRFVQAVKQSKNVVTAKHRKQEEGIRRKATVRLEEDAKAKELVEKLPFGIRNSCSDFGTESSKRNPEYQQSLSQFLHVPSSSAAEKENRLLSRKKLRGSKTEKQVPVSTPSPPKGIFGRIAEVREAGATTPDLAEADVIPSKAPKARRHHKPAPDVTYYDASIPQPPRKYRPPAGLVERIPRKSSEPTAWTEAKQIDSELLKMKIRKSLEAIEKQKIAEERGKRALKIAKLEQEFKQLEAEFMKSVGPETPVLAPVLYSPIKKSLVDLEETAHSRLERTQSSSKSLFDQLDDIGPPSALDWTTESEKLDSTIKSRGPPRYDNDEFFRNIGDILSSDATPNILNDGSFHDFESTLNSESTPNASDDDSLATIESIISTSPIKTILPPIAQVPASKSATVDDSFHNIESPSSSSATSVSGPATPASISTSVSNEEFSGEVETFLSSGSTASVSSPSTSTPISQHSSRGSNNSSLFKDYVKKLLNHRRESIDDMSSSTSESLIVISSSASICSFNSSVLLSPKRTTSSSSHGESSGSDRVDKMSSDIMDISEQLSQTLIHMDDLNETLISESSSSTEAIVTFKLTPRKSTSVAGEVSQDFPSPSSDESLKTTLSALCVRQQFALHVAPIQSDSSSSTYYSADERNIAALRAVGHFRTAAIEPSGQELVPFPYSQPSQGTGSGEEFASSESFREGIENPVPINISRPSPDLQISLENNPFQQLTNEWANITIERPPWL